MVRADARENRSRVLAAAREAFAEDPMVSMNQVAQRAGVGAGTLYRNFPTREALAMAVYAAEVDRIVGSVDDLLARSSPIEALRAWTLDLVEAMKQKHGLGDALSAAAHQTIVDQTYGPVIEAIDRLLDAGKGAGVIRDDADPRDFLQLSGALWRAALGPEDRSGPMLELVIDGLRADHR